MMPNSTVDSRAFFFSFSIFSSHRRCTFVLVDSHRFWHSQVHAITCTVSDDLFIFASLFFALCVFVSVIVFIGLFIFHAVAIRL